MTGTPPSRKSEPIARTPKVARSFQSPALALESEEPPAAIGWLLFSVTGFVLAAIAWASFAEIDELVVSRGELISNVPTIVVQPLELSTIRSIDVKAGDIVKQDQELATLDPTFAQADVDQLTVRLDDLTARQARLAAELAGKEYVPSAAPSPAESLEASLFGQRKKNLADHVEGFQQDLARIDASLNTAQNDVAAVDAQIAVLQEIVDTRRALSDQELGSRLTLLAAQAQLLAARRDMEQSKGSISGLTHQAQSITAQLSAYVEDWRSKVSDELISVKRDRDSTREDLNKALRRRSMTNLRAPRDAIVLEVANRSAGSVLQGAETLFTLVPLDAPLDVVVHIAPNDIGHTKVGDPVRIKLDAFPFQKYGTLSGVIETISADTFNSGSDQRAQPMAGGNAASYYKAMVKLDGTDLPSPPPNYRLLPGMTATADIDVGTRTVISYILYPILGSLDTSAREP